MGGLSANWPCGKVRSRCHQFRRHEEFRLGFAVGHFKRKLGLLALLALLTLALRPAAVRLRAARRNALRFRRRSRAGHLRRTENYVHDPGAAFRYIDRRAKWRSR